ncbi:unnamed protein product [Protopolystoma xenopodis]|uniref:Uncharacterized protein n=1 Tax=Protopolystoma xenopodis TaxID=117903 RepID=A0A448XQ66_9PLAT|nr:unnamed protein product [Protopolystoma xenopodis]
MMRPKQAEVAGATLSWFAGSDRSVAVSRLCSCLQMTTRKVLLVTSFTANLHMCPVGRAFIDSRPCASTLAICRPPHEADRQVDLKNAFSRFSPLRKGIRSQSRRVRPFFTQNRFLSFVLS